MKVETIVHLFREVDPTGLLMVTEIDEKINMVRGSITMRRVALGTGEEVKVAIIIRRDIIEAFTNGPFSLAHAPGLHSSPTIDHFEL
jgi:hypothetical protein